MYVVGAGGQQGYINDKEFHCIKNGMLLRMARKRAAQK